MPKESQREQPQQYDDKPILGGVRITYHTAPSEEGSDIITTTFKIFYMIMGGKK